MIFYIQVVAAIIDRRTYERIIKWKPEGSLQSTEDGGLNINGGTFGFWKGAKIGLYFGNHWLYGRVEKDEQGRHLTDVKRQHSRFKTRDESKAMNLKMT